MQLKHNHFGVALYLYPVVDMWSWLRVIRYPMGCTRAGFSFPTGYPSAIALKTEAPFGLLASLRSPGSCGCDSMRVAYFP